MALAVFSILLLRLTPDGVAQAPDQDSLPVPTIDPALDVMAQDALLFSLQREAIQRDAETHVLLSQSTTPDELETLGLGIGQWEPGCEIQAHLVILQGEFDLRGLMPGWGRTGTDTNVQSARFLAHAYDQYILDRDERIVGGRVAGISSSQALMAHIPPGVGQSGFTAKTRGDTTADAGQRIPCPAL